MTRGFKAGTVWVVSGCHLGLAYCAVLCLLYGTAHSGLQTGARPVPAPTHLPPACPLPLQNTHHIMDAAVPFGGYKQSGIGREHGAAVMEHYTQASLLRRGWVWCRIPALVLTYSCFPGVWLLPDDSWACACTDRCCAWAQGWETPPKVQLLQFREAKGF